MCGYCDSGTICRCTGGNVFAVCPCEKGYYCSVCTHSPGKKAVSGEQLIHDLLSPELRELIEKGGTLKLISQGGGN